MKMKRSFIILFALLYAFLSTGLALNVHYCQGEIEDIFFAGQDDEPSCCAVLCCEAPKETKSSCCEDEVLLIQFDTEQIVVPQKVLDSKEQITGLPPTNQNLKSERIYQKTNTSAPIVQITGSSPPLWLLHCNFTFYG
jgi:hypothetical protein